MPSATRRASRQNPERGHRISGGGREVADENSSREGVTGRIAGGGLQADGEEGEPPGGTVPVEDNENGNPGGGNSRVGDHVLRGLIPQVKSKDRNSRGRVRDC